MTNETFIRPINGAVKLICTIVMLRGGSMDIYIRGKKVNITSVQSTVSMWSILYLGGLGACPHTKILQIWPTEIEFGSNFE